MSFLLFSSSMCNVYTVFLLAYMINYWCQERKKMTKFPVIIKIQRFNGDDNYKSIKINNVPRIV